MRVTQTDEPAPLRRRPARAGRRPWPPDRSVGLREAGRVELGAARVLDAPRSCRRTGRHMRSRCRTRSASPGAGTDSLGCRRAERRRPGTEVARLGGGLNLALASPPNSSAGAPLRLIAARVVAQAAGAGADVELDPHDRRASNARRGCGAGVVGGRDQARREALLGVGGIRIAARDERGRQGHREQACRSLPDPLAGPASSPRHRSRRGLLWHRGRRPARPRGLRTALLCRTADQAERAGRARATTSATCPASSSARAARARATAGHDQLARSDLVFLAVPSKALPDALAELSGWAVGRAGMVSLAKGRCRPRACPDGRARGAPTGRAGRVRRRTLARARDGRVGAGLVCASRSEALAHGVAEAFQRPASSARSPTTRSGSSSPAWPRTPPQSRSARPRRRD